MKTINISDAINSALMTINNPEQTPTIVEVNNDESKYFRLSVKLDSKKGPMSMSTYIDVHYLIKDNILTIDELDETDATGLKIEGIADAEKFMSEYYKLGLCAKPSSYGNLQISQNLADSITAIAKHLLSVHPEVGAVNYKEYSIGRVNGLKPEYYVAKVVGDFAHIEKVVGIEQAFEDKDKENIRIFHDLTKAINFLQGQGITKISFNLGQQ